MRYTAHLCPDEGQSTEANLHRINLTPIYAATHCQLQPCPPPNHTHTNTHSHIPINLAPICVVFSCCDAWHTHSWVHNRKCIEQHTHTHTKHSCRHLMQSRCQRCVKCSIKSAAIASKKLHLATHDISHPCGLYYSCISSSQNAGLTERKPCSTQRRKGKLTSFHLTLRDH